MPNVLSLGAPWVFITTTWSYQYDNFRCNQWWKFVSIWCHVRSSVFEILTWPRGGWQSRCVHSRRFCAGGAVWSRPGNEAARSAVRRERASRGGCLQSRRPGARSPQRDWRPGCSPVRRRAWTAGPSGGWCQLGEGMGICLAYWGPNKTVDILQTTFSKHLRLVCWLNLSPITHLTQWFRWWLGAEQTMV